MRSSLMIGFSIAGLAGLTACGPAISPNQESNPDLTGPSIERTNPGAPPTDYGARARAKLRGPQGERIGDVMVWQGRDGVLIEIDAAHLPPGAHGVHIHETGLCDSADAYTSSGGHIGRMNRPHGLLHPDGTHRSDLPNIHAGADGYARAEFFSRQIRMTDLRDHDGAALVIHATRDDHQSQPIGGAGARIACAAFGSSSTRP